MAPAATRNNDSNPVYGGALIRNPAGGSCSSGIPVKWGNSHGITTAAHCTEGTFRTARGSKIGSTAKSKWTADTQVIHASSPGHSRMWVGFWNSDMSVHVYHVARPAAALASVFLAA